MVHNIVYIGSFIFTHRISAYWEYSKGSFIEYQVSKMGVDLSNNNSFLVRPATVEEFNEIISSLDE